MAQVAIDNLTKVFSNQVAAVDRMRLSTQDGELLVLAGPSGCGKTTTLRLIAGLEKPTSGAIVIGNRDVTRLAPRHRNVSMAFQDSALYPHKDIEGNLAFALRLRKVPRGEIKHRVQHVAEMLEITNLLGRRPHELSGGQRRRAALGRALVHQADCFLLDEPLSHLDVDARRSLRQRIREIHDATRSTMIYVTHDQEEAMALAQRVVVMRHGVLQQCAPPLEIYNRPANRFVANFMAAAPVNFLAGNLKIVGDAILFQRNGFQIELPRGVTSKLASSEVGIELGFRPEAIRLAGDGGPAAGDHISLGRGTICACEPLGDRIDLCVGLEGGEMLRVRTAATAAPRVGDPVALKIAAADILVFSTDEVGTSLIADDRSRENVSQRTGDHD